MEKVKCIEYRGIRDLVAAEVISDTAETFETGTPFHVAWTSNLSRETEASSENHYYDNVAAITINGSGADTVSIDTAAIPLDIIAKLTGQFYEEETGMFIEGEREEKQFAIGYVTEDTSGEEVFVWRLKGTFNVPGETHGTKNDGTDANGQQLTYTGVQTIHKFKKRDKGERAVNCYKSKCPIEESAFFATVQTPDTVKANA